MQSRHWQQERVNIPMSNLRLLTNSSSLIKAQAIRSWVWTPKKRIDWALIPRGTTVHLGKDWGVSPWLANPCYWSCYSSVQLDLKSSVQLDLKSSLNSIILSDNFCCQFVANKLYWLIQFPVSNSSSVVSGISNKQVINTMDILKWRFLSSYQKQTLKLR